MNETKSTIYDPCSECTFNGECDLCFYHKFDVELVNLKKQLKRTREALKDLINFQDDQYKNEPPAKENAPNHGHNVVGIWGGSDGQVCSWCKAWENAKNVLKGNVK